ncbi:GyrI-like domain-containing protein [Shewanella sp. Scap07]|uniref:GyrI-like domain-containing protein n=1 Tax=Shewanella sp. Scap07 TaxID=2589987 RepID=UPI0015BAF4E6|nr:GyrI-like domain-containing protein [Shewanella sp. Scap07]QLE84945.1 GyrI-like domain-containing protein [Shewanella sp. Scap07]
MQPITLTAKQIVGHVVRTDNQLESQQPSQKIAPMWQGFMSQYGQSLYQKHEVYGVYFDYESDHTGSYSALAGAASGVIEGSELHPCAIAPGQYLKFTAQGKMPDVVVNLWQDVWQYFADAECQYQRAFDTDFECYTSADSVDIYIGIH